MKKQYSITIIFILLFIIIVSVAGCDTDGTAITTTWGTLKSYSPPVGNTDTTEPTITPTLTVNSPTIPITTPPATPSPTPTPGPVLYKIEVNVAAQVVTVYSLKDGSIVKQFICSTGTTSNPTPTGTFKIDKQNSWILFPEFGNAKGQYASRFAPSIWFHSITYSEYDPSTLTASGYNTLGNRASHGCVRLRCGDANWIFKNCEIGTQVKVIAGTANPSLTASLKPEHVPLPKVYDSSISKYVYWDPTDPDSSNPWKKGTVVTPKPTVTLKSVAITTAPTKLTYNINEKIDLTGLKVTATYSDNSKKVVTVTASNISGFDSSKIATGQVVTVTYEGKTATFKVNIISPSSPSPSVSPSNNP